MHFYPPDLHAEIFLSICKITEIPNHLQETVLYLQIWKTGRANFQIRKIINKGKKDQQSFPRASGTDSSLRSNELRLQN